MSQKYIKNLVRILIAGMIAISSLANLASAGLAQDDSGLGLTVNPSTDCGEVQFSISWYESVPPYMLLMSFGDGDTTDIIEIQESSYDVTHTYIDQGDYQLTLQVWDNAESTQVLSEILTLEGPQVSLTSNPFPPLFVVGEEGLVQFTANVTGGTGDYSYQWDLDGDGTPEPDTGNTASFTYSEVGKYNPVVTVMDNCSFTASDSLPVVVADPEDACHPMAQTIADGVNTIYPDQSGDLYTCEDIYTLFENESEENNLGFGRMWMAYKLAGSMEELSWEEILDWHLNETGWGSLLQLDRFADLLEEHDLPELMGLVLSEEYSLNDVRTAVRSVTRYEADFEDALDRIAEGATPGDLTQFYKLVSDLETDPEILDEYLAEGMTLSELKHTANFADRMNVDWTEVADARTEADSWGDINQAYRLATEDISATEILIIGIKEYRESLRESVREDRQEKAEIKQEEKTQKTAEQLAEQFSLEAGEVVNLLNGECQGNWGCVRKSLRDQKQEMTGEFSEKDHQTAQQIASQYGYTEEEVLAYHRDYCGEDWSCTRAHFRELFKSSQEKGKPDK